MLYNNDIFFDAEITILVKPKQQVWLFG